MPFPVLGSNSAVAGYEIDNSLRFNYSDSPKLQRTVSSTGSNKVGTFSIWFKRGEDRGSNNLFLFSAHEGSQNYINVGINDADKFQIRAVRDNSEALKYRSNALFRDHSAFYNVVFSLDTAESDGNNAMKLYINGVLQSAYSISNYAQNMEIMFNLAGNSIRVGAKNDDSEPFDGYISEMHYVDGTVKQASDFGEYNDNGVWIPKEYEGTYGTNGFFLQFKQSGVGSGSTSTVGADTSGNTNHFDSTNIAATDQTTDTPTNNFCTFNSIAPDTTGANNHDFYEGNTLIISSSANWFNAFGTIGIPQNGKWYFEYKTTGSGTIDQIVGFCKSNFHRGGDGGADQADCYTLYAASNGNGFLFTDSSSSTNKGTSYSWTHGDIIMVAIDTSSRKIWYGKNGSWLGGGNPATGSSEDQTVSAEDLEYGLLPVISGYHTGSSQFINFGNPAFSISSGNSDANGYGNFEYAVPSGYYALCTKNLAEYG